MTTSSPPMVVPPGQFPPFSVVTDTDHTAWIIIATSLSMSCIMIFSVIKIFLRRRTGLRVGLDESFLAGSTVLAAIQSSIVLANCAKGLGKSIELVPERSLIQIQLMIYVSSLLFLVSLGFSKISVAYLLLRLTPYKRHRWVFYTIASLIATWTVASTFAVALECNPSHPWILIGEKCPRVFLQWQLIAAFDIAFELALVGGTIYLVWGLQTSLEKKANVVFSFGTRLPLIIAIAFRLANFSTVGFTSNPTLLQAKFIVWTQTELSYSIIAATIPSIRPFIKTLATNYGTSPADGYGSGYGTGYGNVSESDNQPGGYEMSTLRPKGDGDEYNYRIWSGKSGSGTEVRPQIVTKADAASVGSSDSQRMIIQKNLAWEVAVDPK